MKKILNQAGIAVSILVALLAVPLGGQACSTFMLNGGPHLVFGHNLNENGIDVPGMVFVNTRGIFKTGRTWSELINLDRRNPSFFTWISRYGSVTFNVFGRDLPDGGMNEVGLYIWEMNENAEFLKNSDLPKLNQMHWMQYNLDMHSTIDEVIESAYAFEIDGWTWHFFVADRRGKSASIAFSNGQVVVHRDDGMPIPALFNEPYGRELRLLEYFEGFGGSYPVQLDHQNTPRFAKAAVMLRDFNPKMDPVDYGFLLLQDLTVAETPKWSVLFDYPNRDVHFKTRLNPEIKRFSLHDLKFSEGEPTLILDIDIPAGGEVGPMFEPYDDSTMVSFLMDLPLPDEFFETGGLTRSGFCQRAAGHWRAAERRENHFFAGNWVQSPSGAGDSSTDEPWTMTVTVDGNAVKGKISRPSWGVVDAPMDHLRMVGERLVFTFRESVPNGEIFEIEAEIHGDRMRARVFGMEDSYGGVTMERVGSSGD